VVKCSRNFGKAIDLKAVAEAIAEYARLGHGRRANPATWHDRGDAAVLGLLLKNGADPQAKDHTGNTALHLAKQSGREDKIAILKTATLHRKAIFIGLPSSSPHSRDTINWCASPAPPPWQPRKRNPPRSPTAIALVMGPVG
jgi:hypothetical protein